MNDKEHFKISIIKSIVRIMACIITLTISRQVSISILTIGLLIAELLGIAEELVDKRK